MKKFLIVLTFFIYVVSYAKLPPAELIDIGIYATTCSDFEVRLSPETDIMSSSLTNVQFAVKYPASVTISNLGYLVPMALQYTTTVGTDKYSVFVGVDIPINNWVSGTEYTVLTFSIDHAASATIDLVIGNDTWTSANNAMYYAELLGLDRTGIISAGATVNLLVHNTDLNRYYCKIQQGIDDAGTGGETIEVAVGIFPENVNINKANLTLTNASSPVIIDGGGSGTVVLISANSVTFEGFTVQNSGTTGNDMGLQLYAVTGCHVVGNTIINNDNGIGIIYASGNYVTSNFINNNTYYGIALAAGIGNTLNLNNISANGLDAIALDNGGASGGLITDGSTGNFIKGNIISSNRDGIFLGENCDNNQVTDVNQITSVTSIGINLWRSGGQTITDNVVNTAAAGIRLLGSSNNTITGNTVTANDIGFKIDASWQVGVWYPSTNNTISSNAISGNTTFGMLADSIHGTVVIAENNWWGHATGPYNVPNNTCGQGNKVSAFVDFMPWWTDNAMTISSGDLPVHNTSQDTYYCKIQDAIDDAGTGGETIEVEAGTFPENININKANLTLTNASSPVIIDGGGSGTVVLISANSVTFEGFTVQNSGTTGNDMGVQLYAVTGCHVVGNTIINNDNGIGIIYASGNYATSNFINNNTYYGIALAAATGNTLNLNNIYANGTDGISLDNGDIVGGNINDGSTGNFIKGNIISSNRDGIFLGENCDNNQVTDINQISASNIGISFWRSGGHTVTDNTITSSGSAIRFLGSSDNIISGNTLTGNDIGLEVDASWQVGVWYASLNNTIFDNNISGNTSYGVDATENQNSVVDAGTNWWGDATGPYRSPDNTCGLGNAVSDYVSICNWYTNVAMNSADLNGCVVLFYDVIGGGSYCDGGIGVSVGLSGSEAAVNYTLYNGVTLVSTLSGTGSSLDFGLQTDAGTYTVKATNTITGCTDILMNSSTTVTVNLLPDAPSAGNVTTTYDGLLHTGTATAPLGSSVVWYDAATDGNVTVAPSGTDVGTYTAWAESVDDLTGCISLARTQVTVTITTAPLTITANVDTKVYDGLAYSGGNGVVYDGFVNGETPAVLGGTLTYGGTSQGAINTGNYAITPGGLTSTNYFITFVDGELTITPVTLGLKVMLQGPYNSGTGLMKTDLYDAGQLPSGQPFGVAPWSYAGSETDAASSTTVDWVLVELRSNVNTMVGRSAGLVNNDGTISISVNDATFPGVHAGEDYYVVIWSRNHMPVMSAAALTMPVASYDFTVLANLYGTNPAINLGGVVYGMVAGDVTANGNLKYSGPGNDRGPIIARIVAETGVNDINGFTAPGYWQEDVTMNSIVLYIGSGNDRGIIQANLATLTGAPYLNNTYTSVVPGAYTGSKDGSNDGPVDIQFAESVSNLNVELVTNEDIMNGLSDNIQFTLAWKTSDTEIQYLLNSFTSVFNLLPQGDVVDEDGISYLTFVSITPVYLPQVWNTGDPISVITFAKTNGQVIANRLWIADNDFTSVNNGEFYVSNWGSDVTGLITGPAVGIENPETGYLKMYPNPVNAGKLFLEVNAENDERLVTEIWNMTGQLVYKSENQVQTGKSILTFDVSEYNTGVYLINVNGEKVHYMDRFIVK